MGAHEFDPLADYVIGDYILGRHIFPDKYYLDADKNSDGLIDIMDVPRR